MFKQFWEICSSIILVLILLGIGLFGYVNGTVLATPLTSVERPDLLTDQTATQLFLPLILRKIPYPINRFGVEINSSHVNTTIQNAAELNITWVRYNGIFWHDA